MRNWKQSRDTIPLSEAGQATTILSTGDNPRRVTQLAVWSGTNSAASTILFGYVSQVPGDISSVRYTVPSFDFCPVGASSATVNAGSELNPLVVMPMGQKGYYSFEGFLVPPNCNLCIWPADVDTNGTVIVSSTSFEITWPGAP
jgi:hypothetical protein